MKKPLKLKEGEFLEKKKPKKSEGLRKIISSGREKLESLVGANLKDAKTKEGKPSKGQMKRSDGSTYGLMGDDLLKIQGRRDQIKGGAKVGAVGTALYGADQAGDYKDKKQADKKAAKEKESKKLTPFQSAFKAAADAGKKTFTFKGKKYNTDRKTEDPKVLRKAVNKAGGGMMKKKGYAKGGAARKSKPRGVGAALRGYGKALR